MQSFVGVVAAVVFNTSPIASASVAGVLDLARLLFLQPPRKYVRDVWWL